jgi:hypothetical protein
VEFRIEALVECARRELTLRRKVYLGLVRRGKMTQEQADREIELMKAILSNLEKQVSDKEPYGRNYCV